MIKRILLSLPLLMLVACGAKDADHGHSHPKGTEEGEAGHKETGAEESEHGTSHQLGKLTAFDREFAVVQMGDVHAGEEGAFELEFASGKDRLTTVRAWVGIESGEGSTKAKFDLEDTANMHGHVDVPDPIPAGSKLWLSLELDGKQEVHSIAYQ